MVLQPCMAGLRRKTLLFGLTRSGIIVAIEFNRRCNHCRKMGSIPRFRVTLYTLENRVEFMEGLMNVRCMGPDRVRVKEEPGTV